MSSSTVLTERDRGVFWITLNRPESLNAINQEMQQALADTWALFRTDSELRVAVLQGAGERAFSAGADLKERASKGDPRTRDVWEQAIPGSLGKTPPIWKPIIAAVHGFCLGGGFELALACDLRLCSDDAQMGLPEIKHGFFAGSGGTVRLARLAPFGVALELLMTGDSVSPERALQWGLVNRVVPRAELKEAVSSLAYRLAEGAPIALQAVKEIAFRCQDMQLGDALRLEASLRALVGLTEDAQEGPRAFVEKRKPRFRGQ
ncbi:MAG TPA: enoyl-CoA hydratase/isomerase family protein [Chloroflexota bacterium]|jgi:enoyl-CoA hydratase/carnithine racemase|nr:enoyl-CoA hydratase/isomerase family protein [Chloroflexota bacterium]